MKILLVDHLSPPGHINFDIIHIKALYDLNYKISFIGKKEHVERFNYGDIIDINTFPNWTFSSWFYKPFTKRILGLVRSVWLLLYEKKNKYDAIIFLSYDVLTLFIFRVKSKVILINHNNVAQLDSSIKAFLTLHLPKHYIHVALSKDMEAELKRKVQNNVYYIPHGFASPSSRIEKPVFFNDGEKFLFCGINNNYNNVFVRELFCSPKLSKYLEEKGVKLLVKKKLLNEYKCNHIIALDNNLSNDEYNYLIQKSLAVLLPYAPEFKYRCSGMLFECIAAKTPVIATRIDAMTSFEGKINIEFFDNVEELISCIESYCNKELINVDEQLFMPQKYWKKLLEEIN